MLQQMLHLYQRAYRGLSPSVWLLAGVMLINRCGTMVLPFMTLYLTQHLHYPVTDAGIIMAVYGMGAFVGTFFGGRFTDRFGFYYVQLISLLLSGAFLLLLQVVTNFYALCGSVFVFTLFGDAFRPANQAAIAHYSEADNRTRAFSLNRLAINLGWSVGGGLGGWLAGIDYRLLFWADGLTCLAAGLMLRLCLPVPTALQTHTLSALASDQTTSEADAAMLPHRDFPFLGVVACNALFLTAFMQFFTIVPLFFREVFRLTEGTIGLLMALNGILVVTVEMALVYALEAQKSSKIGLIMRGIVLTAFSFVVLSLPGWSTQWGLTSLGITLSGLGIAVSYVVLATASEMLVMPFIQSLTVERSHPTTRGQYLALYAMSAALAQTLAPVFGSLMVARFSFTTHWLAIAVLSLVSAGGFWIVGRKIGV